jgi:5'(3')-deoxyribonucleotidase
MAVPSFAILISWDFANSSKRKRLVKSQRYCVSSARLFHLRKYKVLEELNKKQFVAFSDLHITVISTEPTDHSAKGLIFAEILRLVHAQSILFCNYGIVVRGSIVVGDATRSYGRFFGQGIIDAYDVESKQAFYPRIVVHSSVFSEMKNNPKVWTHDDADTEIKAVRNLLHHDQENGVYYVDYLRVIKDELDFPEDYGRYLERFRIQLDKKLSETDDAGARSKLEWMQRYYRRTVKAAIKRGYITKVR